MSLTETKKRELEERKRELKDVLPDLKGLARLSKERPKVMFYKGKQGIRMIHEDILKIKNLKSIEEFVSLDDAYQLFPAHPRDHRHGMGRKINALEKVIYTSRKGAVLSSRQGFIQRHFIPFKESLFHIEVTI